MIEVLKQYELVAEDMYQLKKHEGNYRLFLHKHYPNKFKQIIFLDSDHHKESSTILTLYLKMNEWNPEIESVIILKKLSDNGFLVQLRIKKYNMMAWPRSVIVVAKAVSYHQNSYLIIKSIDEEPGFNDTVKMEWNQLIQVCESEKKNKVLLTIISQFDFKGYCTYENSQEMGLKVMENIKLFESVANPTQACRKISPLFQLRNHILPLPSAAYRKNNIDQKEEGREQQSEPVGFQKKPSIDDSQFEIGSLSESQSIQESVQTMEKEKVEAFAEEGDPMDFAIYMMKSDENAEISLKLLQMLKAKVHERYYLKHKFDQQAHVDAARNQHKISEPNHYFFQSGSWMLSQKGEAIFVNQQIIEMQKDTIKMVLKQLTSHVMSGKSVMNMSLPCELFEPRSVLERIAMGFGYAPSYLVPASKASTVLEQIKFLTAFILSTGILHTNTRKPFNPILGETFECLIGGIPLYLQQISHHPPISSFYMQCQGFKAYGNFNSHVELGLNQVTGMNLSPIYFQFKELNTLYEVKLPYFQVCGLMYGDKKYRPAGLCFIHQRNSNIFVQYNLGKDKSNLYPAKEQLDPNKFYGGVFKVTDQFAKKFRQCENKRKFQGLKSSDVCEKFMSIEGFWNQTYYINGEQMRTMTNPVPNKIQYPLFILPSDSNFRQDIIYKRMGDLKNSNQTKQILENIQRNDRKLRQGQRKKKK